MSENDRADLALLERNLTELSHLQQDADAFRLELRARLFEQANRQSIPPAARRRSRPRRRLLAVGLAVAAAAAAIGVVLAGGSGSGGPSAADAAVIRHLRSAITPPANVILHTKVVGFDASGTAVGGEWWQLTSPPYTSVGSKGPRDSQMEEGHDGATATAYDPLWNTIYERPDDGQPQLADPVSQVRQQLDSGQATVLSTTSIDGTGAYQISLAQGMVGYFDKATYRPLLFDDPQRNGTVVRLRVVAYEYLPTTAENLKLLSIPAQHPDARIDTNPGDWPIGK